MFGKSLKVDYEDFNIVEVSSGRLRSNFDLLAQQSRLDVIPVIKSNAYGHGIIKVALALEQKNPPFFAVNQLSEAIQLRQLINTPILVMGSIWPAAIPDVKIKKTSFVVQNQQEIKAFAKMSGKTKLHLEIDTGMRRQGINPYDIDEYIKLFKETKGVELEGVMSHLADADNPGEGKYTAAQVKLFDALVKRIKDAEFNLKWVHLAQSAGAPKVESEHANAIRPGLAIYGINPYDERDPDFHVYQELLPTLSLKTKIAAIRELQPGDRVSYNGIYRAVHDMRVATLPLGYYEGVDKDLSNKGFLTSSHGQHKIIGKVCMNHTIIDITGKNLEIGDTITVISRERDNVNSIESLKRKFGIFDYQQLTRINSGIARKLVD